MWWHHWLVLFSSDVSSVAAPSLADSQARPAVRLCSSCDVYADNLGLCRSSLRRSICCRISGLLGMLSLMRSLGLLLAHNLAQIPELQRQYLYLCTREASTFVPVSIA